MKRELPVKRPQFETFVRTREAGFDPSCEPRSMWNTENNNLLVAKSYFGKISKIFCNSFQVILKTVANRIAGRNKKSYKRSNQPMFNFKTILAESIG